MACKLFLMLLISFLFGSCKTEMCDLVTYNEALDCLSLDRSKFDSVLIVGSHTYPDEVAIYTRIDYDFSVQADPYSTYLFMKDGGIVSKSIGYCFDYRLSSQLRVQGGIQVVRSNDCYELFRTDQGAFILSSIENGSK